MFNNNLKVMKIKRKELLLKPMIEFESLLYIIKDESNVLLYGILESKIIEKENSIIFKLGNKELEKNKKTNALLVLRKGIIKNLKSFELKIKLPVFTIDSKNLLDKNNDWNTNTIFKKMTELVLSRGDLDKYIDNTIYLCSSKI